MYIGPVRVHYKRMFVRDEAWIFSLQPSATRAGNFIVKHKIEIQSAEKAQRSTDFVSFFLFKKLQ